MASSLSTLPANLCQVFTFSGLFTQDAKNFEMTDCAILIIHSKNVYHKSRTLALYSRMLLAAFNRCYLNEKDSYFPTFWWYINNIGYL